MLRPELHRVGLRFSIFTLALTLAFFTSSVSLAQTVQTGSIAGTVTDPTGAAVPNAKVVITNTATDQNTTMSTNGAGVYNSGSPVPGVYKVRVSAKGFNTTNEMLTVQVSNTANGDIHLQLGQESTIIDVSASAIQVNTQQATVQGVLTAGQIENLPVNGRNFLDLAQLEPGVQIQDGENFDPTKVGYSSISFGGRFGRTARIDVDGVDVSDETVGAMVSIFTRVSRLTPACASALVLLCPDFLCITRRFSGAGAAPELNAESLRPHCITVL